MPLSWRLREHRELIPELLDVADGHPLLARLLEQRGLSDAESARGYLDPAFYRPASPSDLAGMSEALRVVRRALERRHHIRVCGDFDADGLTATALLVQVLTACGGCVDYALPDRDQGHGLSEQAVAEATKDGVSLIITCDTGITDAVPVARARDAGMDVIVTDHHDLGPAMPLATAIVNPKMLPLWHPLRELSGVGVAHMLARGLVEGTPHADLADATLDLVAIGSIADMAAQLGDVRYLCQKGLAALRACTRPGLLALMSLARVEPEQLDEQDIGYQLAPRLNAAGRLADASLVARLLLTADPVEAQALARDLDALNSDRRALTEALVAKIDAALAEEPLGRSAPAILLDGEDWEPGVLGLVAGQVARRFGKPAILIAHRPGQASIGSARSVAGIDIHQVIASQAHLLEREGGHPMAAGFAIARSGVPRFRAAVWTYLARTQAAQGEATLDLDAQIPARELTDGLARALARLAPYGPGNPRPVLLLRDVTMLRSEDVSRTKETGHRRLYVGAGLGNPLRLTWFRAGQLPLTDEHIDIALHLDIDRWRGRETAQLEVVDWRPAERALDSGLRSLHAGREIVDWRQRDGCEHLVAQLRTTYGPRLVLFGEALANARQEDASPPASARAGIVALGILAPPPGPTALRELLRCYDPAVVYLLPLTLAEDTGPTQFVTQLGQVVRHLLADNAGPVDIASLARQFGVTEEVVRAALLGFSASGRISVYESPSALYVVRPGSEHEARVAADARQVPAPEVSACRGLLASLWRDMVAYREAFSHEPADFLFGLSVDS